MARNYLKGTTGDRVNAIMAATALNLRRLLRKIVQEIIITILRGELFHINRLKPVQIHNYY